MDRRAVGAKRRWEDGDRMSELVRLTDITKVYQGGVTGTLNGVSLSIDGGEFSAIMGPSGSGKSTLLNLVAGLDRPSSGSVVVGGTDLGRLGEAGLARFRRDRVGFVVQFFHLLPNPPAPENALIPAQLKSRASLEAARRPPPSRVGSRETCHSPPAHATRRPPAA